jgi:hypothetical protein
MIDALESLLFLHPRFWLSMHILGVCVGLGGATIADMLFFKFLKDFRISNKEADVMRSVSHVILGSLVLIIVSGAALYVPNMPKYNASAAFIVKMAIVGVLTLNGLVLHGYVSPKLVKLSFTSHHRTTPKLRRLRHLAFGLGAVSATSWYTTFFLAMLKSLLPEDVTVSQLLLAYACIVAMGVCASQFIECRLHRRVLSLQH